MSRRRRALGFASAAALCAGLAASAGGGYRTDLADSLGELGEVVVAVQAVPAGRRLGGSTIERAFEVRRVPDRFIPSGALSSAEYLVGRVPRIAIPPGSYVLGSQLRSPRARRAQAPGSAIGDGLRPVEVSVTAAGAIAGAGAPPTRVDVIVTTEPAAGGTGRTFIAARAVDLLDLRPAGASADSSDPLTGGTLDTWVATLALRRRQALRLIQAESYARSLRLIATEEHRSR